MAEYATVPSCSKLPLQKSFYKLSSFIPILHSCRKLSYGKFSVITRLSSRKNYVFSVPTAPLLRRPMSIKESFSSCCLGTLMDLENVTPSNWTPVVDDLLLTIGVFLTYMAGIIPSQKAYSSSRQNVSNYDAVTANLTSLGSDMNSEFNPVYVWDEVRRKLMIALNAVIQDDNLNSKVDQREKSSEKLPFSLYAIAEIPRLRLLQATLQQLEKEVSNISESYETVNKDNQSGLVLEIVKKCGKSVCLAWLEEELYLESRKHDKALLSTTFRKLKDEDTILQNIKKSSKDDIYEDLLFYLRFGSIREGSCYDLKFLVQHGVDILEDLVITMSDGITGLYLELISVDSDMSSEMSRLGLDLCSLSTRALQRLRNEVTEKCLKVVGIKCIGDSRVALDRWLHQNIESVVSMYEDRFDLWTFQIQPLERPDINQTDERSWWKKLIFNKRASTLPSLCSVAIKQLSVPVKRTMELRALSGWRYYFSLFLEFSDITMPFVRSVVEKISSAISFFLVCLIGRSLGLIYTGIRQALGWR